MSKTIKGTIHNAPRPSAAVTRITIDLDQPTTFRSGDVIEITKVLTNEEIGRRLRAMLAPSAASGSPLSNARQLRELADSVQDEAGWTVLANLIREVAES